MRNKPLAVAGMLIAFTGAGHAYNLDVKLSGLSLGRHLMGPERRTEELANQVVLVEFWGYYCPPCRASLPKLAAWQKEYESVGLVIIGVHVQRATDEQIKALCREKGVNFTIVADGSIQGGNDFNAIPHCFLFDANGNCLYRGHPAEPDLLAAMRKALEEAPAALLSGKDFKKLAPLVESLKKGASYGSVLKAAQAKVGSPNLETAEEARYIVARLTEYAEKRQKKALAKKTDEPCACWAELNVLAEAFSGTEPGKEAAMALSELKKDSGFMESLKPWEALQALKKMEGLLKPVDTPAGPDTRSSRFQQQNALILRQMLEALRVMRQKWPASKATEEAQKILAQYGLGV